MKQVNLSLAAAGDVAVLRNGEKREIESRGFILNWVGRLCFRVKYAQKSHSIAYYNNGTPKLASDDISITDILRNGKSIFEQPTE